MKAALVRSPNDGYFDLVDDWQPRPLGINQALVNVEYCGLCHTDLHGAFGRFGDPNKIGTRNGKYRRVTGHEGVGKVAKLGPGADKYLKVGDRVSIAFFYDADGTCQYCVTGNETFCPNVRFSGLSVDGAMSQQVVVDAPYAVKVPQNLNPVYATSIACAGLTVYKALKVGHTKPGSWVSIHGLGGLGNLAVQYAAHVFGARVVAIDGNPDKLKAAKENGAEVLINRKKPRIDVPGEIQKQVGGVKVAIITAVSQPAFKQAISSLATLGTAVSVAFPKGDMSLNIAQTALSGISVKGTLVGTRQDLKEAFAFGAAGKVKPIVQTVDFSTLNQVAADMYAGKITGRKVVDFTRLN